MAEIMVVHKGHRMPLQDFLARYNDTLLREAAIQKAMSRLESLGIEPESTIIKSYTDRAKAIVKLGPGLEYVSVVRLEDVERYTYIDPTFILEHK